MSVRPGEGRGGLEHGQIGFAGPERLQALGLLPSGWTRQTGRRVPGTLLPPCGAPAPPPHPKCCRNKKPRLLRPGEERERQREPEGGSGASAAQVSISWLPSPPTPAGPRPPPGEQKRAAAHHAATRSAARALLVNAQAHARPLGPPGHAPLCTHRSAPAPSARGRRRPHLTR